MKELAGKVQIVINTIQDLDIKSTFSNMNRLMGAMQTLAGIRDELEKVAEDRNDGNADAE